MTRRVMHLCKGLNRGGAEVLLAELFRERPSPSMSFGYLVAGADDVARDLVGAGAHVTGFGASSAAGVLATAAAVARHLRLERIDIVHAHLPLAGVVARIAGRLAGVPVVYSEHNRFDSYHPLTRAAAIATWQMQEHVIAVSADVAVSLGARGQTPPITVVRNGIATDRFVGDGSGRRLIRGKLGIDDDAFVVGTVAVFRPAKQLDVWLDVVARLARSLPTLRAILVGYGPQEPDVRRWISERGLDDVVHLAGVQRDVRPWLQAMDVFLMTSAWEGLPVAALEAMSSALPVVSTDVGGVGEAVDGDVGALVAAADVSALVAAVAAFVEAPERRRLVGLAARARARARFGIERMSTALEDIYAEVEAAR